jgi:hypothetical protein
MAEPLSLEERSRQFAEKAGLQLVAKYGYGIDGTVWQTSRQSALKVFAREDTYRRERDCYVRLFENAVQFLAGFAVPELLDYSNTLWAIEMTPVGPPCILDFGKAYVDQPPDYSAEALAEAEQAERELFSEEQWKQVRLVRAALRRYGIHYFDARPSNIMFPRHPGTSQSRE